MHQPSAMKPPQVLDPSKGSETLESLGENQLKWWTISWTSVKLCLMDCSSSWVTMLLPHRGTPNWLRAFPGSLLGRLPPSQLYPWLLISPSQGLTPDIVQLAKSHMAFIPPQLVSKWSPVPWGYWLYHYCRRVWTSLQWLSNIKPKWLSCSQLFPHSWLGRVPHPLSLQGSHHL